MNTDLTPITDYNLRVIDTGLSEGDEVVDASDCRKLERRFRECYAMLRRAHDFMNTPGTSLDTEEAHALIYDMRTPIIFGPDTL